MKRFALVTSLVAGILLSFSSPSFAQHLEFLTQGPWNIYAQKRGPASYRASGIPPRNAQCGWYMGKITGHHDRSLWLAQNWARRFPRGPAAPGKIVVWRTRGIHGHVAKIVSMQGNCRAVVHDNAGTYSRDICRGVIAYVQP